LSKTPIYVLISVEIAKPKCELKDCLWCCEEKDTKFLVVSSFYRMQGIQAIQIVNRTIGYVEWLESHSEDILADAKA